MRGGDGEVHVDIVPDPTAWERGLRSVRQAGMTSAMRAAAEWEALVSEFSAALNRSTADVRAMLEAYRREDVDATPERARRELQQALARYTPATLPRPAAAPPLPRAPGPQPGVKVQAKRQRRRAQNRARRAGRH